MFPCKFNPSCQIQKQLLFQGSHLRSSHNRCSVKKMFLEISQNSHESTCARVSFLIKFIKKETLVQVLSCEFCKISRNTFFQRTPLVAVSANWCVQSILIKISSIYLNKTHQNSTNISRNLEKWPKLLNCFPVNLPSPSCHIQKQLPGGVLWIKCP